MTTKNNLINMLVRCVGKAKQPIRVELPSGIGYTDVIDADLFLQALEAEREKGEV